MKISKFVRDLLITGFTQVIILLLGMVLLKIMATVLSKEYFGIYMVIVKMVAVGVPFVTLGLTVGMVRYVSYKREKEREFLGNGLLTVISVSLLIFLAFFLLRKPLAQLLFKAIKYRDFVILASIFIFGNSLFSLCYSYFRGRQEIIKANRMQIFYSVFPVVLVFILWKIFQNNYSKMLMLYFIFFSLWGIILGTGHIRSNVLLNVWTNVNNKGQEIKQFFLYSISRIPSSFFYAFTFSIPVFMSSRYLSLVAAGYMGIAVAVVRLTELFAIPFDVLFLPKFAEVKKRSNSQEITQKASIVVEFIITVLPLLVVILYGLSKYLVIIWFGNKYISTVPVVSLVILFSAFYLAYILTRGILDGLFSFPYKNIICLGSFLTICIFSLLFHQSFFILGIGYGLGLLVMGSTAIYILIRKTGISLRVGKILFPLVLALFIFIVLFLFDKWVEGLYATNQWLKLGLMFSGRAFILLASFLLYWKPKTLWVRELLYRVR